MNLFFIKEDWKKSYGPLLALPWSQQRKYIGQKGKRNATMKGKTFLRGDKKEGRVNICIMVLLTNQSNQLDPPIYKRVTAFSLWDFYFHTHYILDY